MFTIQNPDFYIKKKKTEEARFGEKELLDNKLSQQVMSINKENSYFPGVDVMNPEEWNILTAF